MGLTREEYGNAYQSGFPLTVRFLQSKGVPFETAEETAQAAWTRGWERLAQLRDPSLVSTWANTIALNLYRTRLRREPRREVLPEIPVVPNVNMAAIDVRHILGACKVKERLALRRYYLEGYLAGEIAEKQGISETAVRLRLMRARRAARKTLWTSPVRKGPFFGLSEIAA